VRNRRFWREFLSFKNDVICQDRLRLIVRKRWGHGDFCRVPASFCGVFGHSSTHGAKMRCRQAWLLNEGTRRPTCSIAKMPKKT
jgi:hypothetical protein